MHMSKKNIERFPLGCILGSIARSDRLAVYGLSLLCCSVDALQVFVAEPEAFRFGLRVKFER